MLARTNQYIEEAVSTIRQLTQEEKIRQQCESPGGLLPAHCRPRGASQENHSGAGPCFRRTGTSATASQKTRH